MFVVANPRGIPAGIHVLRTAAKEWYEGDEIAVTDVKDVKDFASLIAQGYVIEVKDG